MYSDDVEGEYLSAEFVEQSLDSDEISAEEAWFIYGWKRAIPR